MDTPIIPFEHHVSKKRKRCDYETMAPLGLAPLVWKSNDVTKRRKLRVVRTYLLYQFSKIDL